MAAERPCPYPLPLPARRCSVMQQAGGKDLEELGQLMAHGKLKVHLDR